MRGRFSYGMHHSLYLFQVLLTNSKYHSLNKSSKLVLQS